MTPLQLLLDGGLAAAELLALALVPPAAAATTGQSAASPVEPAVEWHRSSRASGQAMDTLRAVHAGRAIARLAAECAEPVAGHARLTLDEAIADASARSDADALLHAVSAAETPAGEVARVALPAPLRAQAPRALLIEREETWLLAVVPHRRATAATLVLRPVSGDARWLRVGAIEPGVALLVRLASRHALDDLDQGAIEVELADGAATVWSTIVAERIDERAVQAGAAD